MSLCVSAPAVAVPPASVAPASIATRLRRLLHPSVEAPSAGEDFDAGTAFADRHPAASAAPPPRRRSALGETNVLLL